MADDTRQTPRDLADAGADMDFFHMLALLEQGGKRFGHAGGPDREPARLDQSPRLTFATGDLAKITYSRDAQTAPHIAVNVLGLLGPEGPMPLHITRWVMERLSNRWFAGDDATALADTSFLDLVNMLQHRMLALYWRAWADAQITALTSCSARLLASDCRAHAAKTQQKTRRNSATRPRSCKTDTRRSGSVPI
jgi:type VI secretion system protein ImpH